MVKTTFWVSQYERDRNKAQEVLARVDPFTLLNKQKYTLPWISMIEIEEINDLRSDTCISKVISETEFRIEHEVIESAKQLTAAFEETPDAVQVNLDESTLDANEDEKDNTCDSKVEPASENAAASSESEVVEISEEEPICKYGENEETGQEIDGGDNSDLADLMSELHPEEPVEENEEPEKREIIPDKDYEFDPKKHGVR